MASTTAPAAARGKGASLTELAALALTEGVNLKERHTSLEPISETGNEPDTLKERRALFALLRTGKDADALEAVREFARLGGAANCKQLAAIMKDEGWSDAVRTSAALALLKAGTSSDGSLAIRALGAIGGDTNTATLSKMAGDTSLPDNVRVEAALGLGSIGSPAAGDALIAAFQTFPDRDIQEQLLDSLGHFPFEQIEETWKEFLANPETPRSLRAAAAEALANSSPEAVPFLKTLAAEDRDPNVREEAAWAISVQGKDGNLGSELARMAVAEPEADVRRRLYEALLTQADNPAESILATIRNESDIAARVAGFNALADAVKRNASSSLTTEFNSTMVPELQEIALSANTVNIRMRAVFALRRAGTAAAGQALQIISQTQNPKIAQAAFHGLPTSK